MNGGARYWGGEGQWTLTGGCMTPHVQAAGRGVETVDKFISPAAWHDAIGWSLDAPWYVARGGIESCYIDGEHVFFASERRP